MKNDPNDLLFENDSNDLLSQSSQESSSVDSNDLLSQSKTNNENVSTLDRFMGASVSGPSGIKNPEDSLTMLGQFSGQTIGTATGGPVGGYVGSVTGTAVGSALEEIIKSSKYGRDFNLNKVKSDTAMTALTDGLLRGVSSGYFRREIANETMNSLGRKIGEMKTAISDMGSNNPSLSVPKAKIVNFLDDTFGKTLNPFGKASLVLKRWRNILSDPKTTHISPRALIELEDDLGDVAKFANQKLGGVSLVPDVQKSAMNTAAKRLRGIVSSEVDDVATKAGFPQFAKNSKQLSKLKEKFPTSELKKNTLFPGIPQTFAAATGGAIAGIGTGNPLVGLSAGFLIESLQSPAIRSSLYDGMTRRGMGNIVSLLASESVRKIDNEQ